MALTVALSEEVRPILDALALSPDALFVTDRNNRIVLWNKAVEHLLGYSSDEVAGYSCCSVLLGSDRFGNRYCSAPCPVIQIASRGESVRRFELTFTTKSKQLIDAEIQILTIPAPAPHRFLLSHIIRRVDGRHHQPPMAPHEAADAPTTTTHAKAAESTDVRAHRLTRREIEVLGMLASGLHVADIGERLGIALLTARNHVQNILEKLEVHSKSEAVAFAFRQKLL